MMGDDLRPKQVTPDVLRVGGSRSSTPRLSRNPSVAGSTAGRNPSVAGSTAADRPASRVSSTGGLPPQRVLKTTSEMVAPRGLAPAGPPVSASMPPVPSGGKGHAAGALPTRPITARSIGSQSHESLRASRPSTAVSFPSRPATATNRPETALTRNSSRPGTAVRPVTSGTIFSMSQIRPDTMCLEANCCAAVGNSALREDCLERVGKFDGVMLAIIHLLENGTLWAQGHAARTLGNLLPSAVNLKFLSQIDTRNMAASAVSNNSKTCLRSKTCVFGVLWVCVQIVCPC